MKEFLAFLTAITTPLIELWQYSQRPVEQRSEEEEKQIAMRIIRAAGEAEVRRSLEET